MKIEIDDCLQQPPGQRQTPSALPERRSPLRLSILYVNTQDAFVHELVDARTAVRICPATVDLSSRTPPRQVVACHFRHRTPTSPLRYGCLSISGTNRP